MHQYEVADPVYVFHSSPLRTFGFLCNLQNSWDPEPNKILILGRVGFQSDQITAASWSGNTCQPSNQLIITLIRILFANTVPRTNLILSA